MGAISVTKILTFACLILATSLTSAAARFHRSQEFPNLFLKEEYRQMQPNQIPIAEIERARAMLNSSLLHLLNRMSMPITADGGKTSKVVAIYPYLQDQLELRYSGTKVLPAAGPLRSALGKLYQLAWDNYHENGAFDPETFFADLDSSKSLIPFQEIIGVGSDFDGLTVGPDKDAEGAGELLKTVVNSVRLSNRVEFSRDGINRSIFPLADFKPYEQQISRATDQGGSTIDFLAFDLQKAELLNPPRFPQTSENFLRGIRSYSSPLEFVEVDPALQAVRGMRPATELPFLALDPVSQKAIARDLRLALLQTGPTDKTIEQIEKSIRNSRFSAGNNLLWRSDRNSPENLFLKFTERVKKIFPEFLEYHPIRKGSRRPLNGFPEELLTSPEELMRMTNGGVVYHGTPSPENLLSIIRNNFLVSRDIFDGIRGQGSSAARGVGTYTAFKTGGRYSVADGITIPLQLRTDVHLNVLDFSLLERDPRLIKLKELALARGEEINEYLARYHGIDTIYSVTDDEVILLNSAAIERPSPDLIAEYMFKGINNPRASLDEKFRLLSELERFAHFQQQIGVDITALYQRIFNSEVIQVDLIRILPSIADFSNQMRNRALDYLRNVEEPSQAGLSALQKAVVSGVRNSYARPDVAMTKDAKAILSSWQKKIKTGSETKAKAKECRALFLN